MSVSAVIPARLGSKRLPRKLLDDIDGHPLIWHVWRRATEAESLTDTYVATDSHEIRELVQSWGGRVLMTNPECRSGTERIASALDQISGEFIVNVQGDNALLDPDLIDSLVHQGEVKQADIITPVYRITNSTELQSSNVVKVVRSHDDRGLYFSRSPIPLVRDVPEERWIEEHSFWGHVGVYGYRRAALAAYTKLPESPLESAEKLEQLRFLDAGWAIQTFETDYHPVSVDTLKDLDRVRMIVSGRE